MEKNKKQLQKNANNWQIIATGFENTLHATLFLHKDSVATCSQSQLKHDSRK